MISDHREMTRRLLRFFRQASPEQIAQGLSWYDRAYTDCERIGWLHGYTVTQTAVTVAHLSPRMHWADNLALAEAVLAGKPKPEWSLTERWDKARAALLAEDPLATFSPRARKTFHFARAILGDPNAVPVDTWMERVLGLREGATRTRAGYNASLSAIDRGARIEGLTPRDLQAVTWVVYRGSPD
jgi:hypothetical protein